MTPTRAAAIERLEAFLPRAGSKYASHRNFDHGPGDRSNISMLSPYIRHRLITEEEVSKRVLDYHSPRSAEKFLQEIAWRTYWKGWLEMRPAVWSDYLHDLSILPKAGAYQQAIEGRTGLECFDAWAKELIEYGYLHNHTRMWFASIWIFTLQLPWQLGTDFFMRHLMDADPASNTLSWRWVAGLHTPGKHYLARAWNIEKYTSGRFNPHGQLNESAKPLPLDRSYQREPLSIAENPTPSGRVGLLISPDDLSPEPSKLGPIASTAILMPAVHTPFLEGAIHDTRLRLEACLLEGDSGSAISDWITRENLEHITCIKPTTGPWSGVLNGIDAPIHFFVNNWDRRLWPMATAGFFKLKKSLPELHRSLAGEAQPELF
ncbi:FAD-binding domain-containing protein [Haloferula sp.]|uniref:FAD-binding domain-containing protein n=1 Tax=Haloferula sp. TaxID=2497595 RepID=UPI003C7278FC